MDRYYHLGLNHASLQQNIPAVEYFTHAIEKTSSMRFKVLYTHERAKALQMERYYDEVYHLHKLFIQTVFSNSSILRQFSILPRYWFTIQQMRMHFFVVDLLTNPLGI